MTDRNPKSRRAPSTFTGRRIRPPNPGSCSHRRIPAPLRQTKARNPAVRILSRSASAPTLWTVRLVSGRFLGDDGGFGRYGVGDGGSSGIGESMFLPRPHTWTDIFSPSLLLQSPTPSPRNSLEEAKVVVSVTVEGSPGPVRAMVRLGDSVGAAITTVVQKYGKEERSPRLDREAADSFQLHYSHFSLQSLNKSDKIGEVGGRSFYLRKSSFSFGREGGGSEVELQDGRPHAVAPPTHLLFSFIAKRLSKIRRRTRKLWKVVLCITCG